MNFTNDYLSHFVTTNTAFNNASYFLNAYVSQVKNGLLIIMVLLFLVVWIPIRIKGYDKFGLVKGLSFLLLLYYLSFLYFIK